MLLMANLSVTKLSNPGELREVGMEKGELIFLISFLILSFPFPSPLGWLSWSWDKEAGALSLITVEFSRIQSCSGGCTGFSKEDGAVLEL